MGSQVRDAYLPDAANADAYDELYAHYTRLHDHFGRGGDDVMHALRRPRAGAGRVTAELRRSVCDAAPRAAAARARRLDERQPLGARARART